MNEASGFQSTQSVFSEGRLCFPWIRNRKENEEGKESDLMSLISQMSPKKL